MGPAWPADGPKPRPLEASASCAPAPHRPEFAFRYRTARNPTTPEEARANPCSGRHRGRWAACTGVADGRPPAPAGRPQGFGRRAGRSIPVFPLRPAVVEGPPAAGETLFACGSPPARTCRLRRAIIPARGGDGRRSALGARRSRTAIVRACCKGGARRIGANRGCVRRMPAGSSGRRLGRLLASGVTVPGKCRPPSRSPRAGAVAHAHRPARRRIFSRPLASIRRPGGVPVGRSICRAVPTREMKPCRPQPRAASAPATGRSAHARHAAPAPAPGWPSGPGASAALAGLLPPAAEEAGQGRHDHRGQNRGRRDQQDGEGQRPLP